MKSLEEKIAAVRQAEADCARQRAEAHQAWHHLQDEVRRTATPVRIVVSGLAVGFASGLAAPGAAAAANGKLVSGPVFSMLLDTVVPGLLAGITAAATAQGEAGEGAGVAVEETIEAAKPEPLADAAPPKPRRKRKPKAAPGEPSQA